MVVYLMTPPYQYFLTYYLPAQRCWMTVVFHLCSFLITWFCSNAFPMWQRIVHTNVQRFWMKTPFWPLPKNRTDQHQLSRVNWLCQSDIELRKNYLNYKMGASRTRLNHNFIAIYLVVIFLSCTSRSNRTSEELTHGKNAAKFQWILLNTLLT